MKGLAMMAAMFLAVAIVAACRFDGVDTSTPDSTAAPRTTLAPIYSSSTREEKVEPVKTPAPVSVESTISTSGPVWTAPIGYDGDTSIEERISTSDAVVKARLVRISTDVFTTSDQDWSSNFYVAVKFHFTVSEYLMGSGSNNIVAIRVSLERFDSQQGAEDEASRILGKRNTAWDDRDAILFLRGNDPTKIFNRSLLGGGDYFLTSGGDFAGEDFYSVTSKYDRRWLPAAGTTATRDQQEFLLAVPEVGMAIPTITLGELKRRVLSVNAELNGGDGSEEYRECIQLKYYIDRKQDWQRTNDIQGRGHWYAPRQENVFVSGQADGAILYGYREGFADADPPETKTQFWIDGQDSILFSVEFGVLRTAPDWDGDGQADGFVFDQRVVSERPIPAGTYKFNNHFIPYDLLACSHTYSYEMMVDVVAPDGVLHEAFFDPVTVGASVAADSSNGVLKPTAFTDANGSSANLTRIAWESGTVKINVTPDGALVGHIVDFIEQDGTVELSLDVAAATADTVNDSLGWTVASQPWQNGDQLMVRIRRDPPSCSGGVVVPNPVNAPDLVKDCEALLWVKDILEGTGSLNWGVDTAITGWDGVTVGGSPQQITGLDLSSRSLNGIIQSKLAELGGLSNLNLSNNQLMGEIPFELSDLTDLSRLRLAGNGFSGCIPPTLGEVSDHDLGDVHLEFCGATSPSPQGLSVAVTDVGFDISWSRLTGVSQYQVHYRSGGSAADWINHFPTVNTTQTLNPEGGLPCGTSYEFRVRAEGDGTVYIAEWSDWSQPVTVSTGECETPMLGAT